MTRWPFRNNPEPPDEGEHYEGCTDDESCRCLEIMGERKQDAVKRQSDYERDNDD